MLLNAIVAFVSVAFTINRESYSERTKVVELVTTATVTTCWFTTLVKSILENATPPESYVHRKVTLSPSTTRSGFGGAAVILGACDSKKENGLYYFY